ncbi:hypothetical protein [Caballeronia sp. J97]|uniref:hypothetical protein n=1 Tax=Caballeronia sp. J97 TaxID=2805429 RepID=UPI002AB08A28|nr:hypothetical protein [Caballeronia sp. J97]
MDLKEQAPDDSGATPIGNEEPTKRDALSGVDRVVQLADLNHPGVQKLVLDRLDRAEARVLELERYRQDYHDTREKLVVAESSLKRIMSLDVLQSTLLGVGCMAIGLLPTAWGNWGLFCIGGLGGLAMVVGSFVSKFRNTR